MAELHETRVVFFGASIVSEEAARLARYLGFSVLVLGDDAERLAEPGFAGCETRVVDFLDTATIDPIEVKEGDMLCVITPGHEFDRQMFVYAMQTPAFYIGMMGKPAKNAKCVEYALEHGCTQAQIDRCTFPIGLPIGAITVREIALSIVAQLVQKHNERYPRVKDHEALHAK